MRNVSRIRIVLAAGAVSFALQATADVVFEESTSQSGMPMGGGAGMKTKVLISGDKYRAQKKLAVDKDAMAGQMKFQQQMGGVNMGMMNQIQRGGHPNYPDHIMSIHEWGQFDENKQLMEEATKTAEKENDHSLSGMAGKLMNSSSGFGGLGGGLMGSLLGKKEEAKPATNVGDVFKKYCDELDMGILAKKQDEGAAKMAQGGSIGDMVSLEMATDYDSWLRAKIIRDKCPNPQQEGLAVGGFGGGRGTKSASFSEMIKISDDKSSEYADLKREYEKKSEYKAEYAKGREKNKEMAAGVDQKMKQGMAGAADVANNMMLNVQIVRLDTGKVVELFPPKNAKDPKPEDVTYKEETVGDLKDKADEATAKKQKAMKANEGKMKEADAKMAAARAKYGDAALGALAKPEAKKIGNETLNGIACEHWQVSGMAGVDDYWVSRSFAGADEIMAFEAKLKQKVGTGRDGLTFGGMPDMSSMMAGMDPAMDAEVARIKEHGVVIKHVNTMKNAAPSQASMLQNQQAMAGDLGSMGAAQNAQSQQAMKGMSASQKAAMMMDPAAMQKMMGSQNMAAGAQAAAEKHQAAGDFNTSDRQDMSSTYELKVVGTGPVPAAAFEIPAGATRK